MPPPLVVVPTLHVVSKAVISAATSVDGYAISSATLAYILARLAWNRIPPWIKEDVALRNLIGNSKNKNGSSNSSSGGGGGAMQMGTLASVIEKLQALFQTASEKLSLELQPVPYLQASFWAYIQLETQLHALHSSQYRRQWYDVSNTAASIPTTIDATAAATNAQPTGCRSPTNGFVEHACDIKQGLNYAIWAYTMETDQLQKDLLQVHDDLMVLQHNTLIEAVRRPGQVGHYMAVSATQQLIVIGIRGTSSLEDLFADCCGQAVSYPNPSLESARGSYYEDYSSPRVEVRAAQAHQVLYRDSGTTAPALDHNAADSIINITAMEEIEIVSGHERIWVEEAWNGGSGRGSNSSAHECVETQYSIRCHEGILICALRLVDKIQPTMEALVLDKGYRILLCGHSLGAGVASLAAVVLRTRFPLLANDAVQTNVTASPSATMSQSRIQVFAFGPPPVLDHDSAIAACSYTTSVVNNADIISRASLANLAIFVEFLRSVSTQLQERGMAPTTPAATASFFRHIVCGNGRLPLPPPDVSQSNDSPKDVKETNTDDYSLLMSLEQVQAAMKAAHDQIELRNPDHLYIPGRTLILFEERGQVGTTSASPRGGNKSGVWKYSVTDGSAAVLRLFECDSLRMVTDHATASYEIGVEQCFYSQLPSVVEFTSNDAA